MDEPPLAYCTDPTIELGDGVEIVGIWPQSPLPRLMYHFGYKLTFGMRRKCREEFQ